MAHIVKALLSIVTSSVNNYSVRLLMENIFKLITLLLLHIKLKVLTCCIVTLQKKIVVTLLPLLAGYKIVVLNEFL
jgi:hypothetical protein